MAQPRIVHGSKLAYDPHTKTVFLSYEDQPASWYPAHHDSQLLISGIRAASDFTDLCNVVAKSCGLYFVPVGDNTGQFPIYEFRDPDLE